MHMYVDTYVQIHKYIHKYVQSKRIMKMTFQKGVLVKLAEMLFSLREVLMMMTLLKLIFTSLTDKGAKRERVCPWKA